MKEMLVAKDVNKIYEMSKKNQYHVLKDLNLIINKGEFVSVMGPSGSGKSTLLYNISGMDNVTSGEVFFNGTSIATCKEKELSSIRLQKMGFVFQQSHLMKDLNIIDNILLPGFALSKNKRNEIRSKGYQLLKEMGIEELAENMITEASGGQLQRVSICRALINSPEILFGDEPTGALNTKAAADVLDVFKSINEQGTTVMIVTHDPKVAAQTERVLFMKDGELVSEMYLGKYTKRSEIRDREKRLNEWLVQLGL